MYIVYDLICERNKNRLKLCRMVFGMIYFSFGYIPAVGYSAIRNGASAKI